MMRAAADGPVHETAEDGHAERATSAVQARTSALIHEFAWRRTSD